MVLRQFMEAKGYVWRGGNKCICPFHGDRSPSAILNLNSIYCFTCGRLYGLWDFQQAFSVVLDRVPEEDSACLDAINGKPSYQFNQVLFTYPFTINNSHL